MSVPTYEDANILLQIAQWWAVSGMNENLNWTWSDDFEAGYEAFTAKFPPGSDGFGSVMNVLGAFETVGTLWKNGLFNETLLFDWIAVGMVWDRVGGIALGIRNATGNLRLYENFEAMAAAQPD